MDMLHFFSLFIYKRQQPQSLPPSNAPPSQTGTRFLRGREVVDVILGPEGKIGSGMGEFLGFGVFGGRKEKKKKGWFESLFLLFF